MPPVVTNFIPTPPASILGTDSVTFDVTDASGTVSLTTVWIKYPSLGITEMAYSGTSLLLPYTGTVTSITDGNRFVLQRGPTWRADFEVHVSASDPYGNVLVSGAYSYTIPPATGVPVIDNFSPMEGTTIGKFDYITFDVTDDSGSFSSIMVYVDFPSIDNSEVIHDGDAFRGFYVGVSSRSAIAGGFRYSVIRAGGWPDTPSIYVKAVDNEGNESA